MDELLRALQEVSVQLLPFLGVVVLIFLILILRRVYLLLADVGHTVIKVNTAMDKVNSSLDEFKAPLSTLSRLSNSIDLVHTATRNCWVNKTWQGSFNCNPPPREGSQHLWPALYAMQQN